MKSKVGFFAMRGVSKSLKAIGMEKLAWDVEHKTNFWQTSKKSEQMLEILSNLLNGGAIVEFGCGDGTFPQYLPDNGFSKYVGYDISSVAIKMCNDKNENPKVNFETQDMGTWEGLGNNEVDLIVCEECLNYLEEDALIKFLQVCCETLTESGKMFISFHSHIKHAASIETIKRTVEIVDESFQGERVYLTATSKLRI